MEILLLFVIILTLIFLLDFFKVNKVVRFALLVDIAMAMMIIHVDQQIPAVYYLFLVLSLFTYMYCISGMILKTALIKGRIYRFALILIGIVLCLGAMQLFEDRFCPVNYDYGINASRLIQVLGPAALLLFIVDEIKSFINND